GLLISKIDLQLHRSHETFSFLDAGFDVVIRFGDARDTRLSARTQAHSRRVLCASPAYLERAGDPTHPTELQAHQYIIIRESDETYGTWHLTQGTQTQTVKVSGSVSS